MSRGISQWGQSINNNTQTAFNILTSISFNNIWILSAYDSYGSSSDYSYFWGLVYTRLINSTTVRMQLIRDYNNIIEFNTSVGLYDWIAIGN